MSPELLEDDVEQVAFDILVSVGWDWMHCFEETFGDGSELGRDNRGQAYLPKKLRAALSTLNPDLPVAALNEAFDIITRDRSAMSLVRANREIYELIKDGVSVEAVGPDGEVETVRVKVVDFEHPPNNDFFVARQFWVIGEIEKCRADLVGFVNGLPLVFIELKGAHKNVKNAYTESLARYRKDIPQIFWFNAVSILSNGLDSRVGSVTATFDYFKQWKRIEREDEPAAVSIETVLRGVCDKRRLLDIVENFTVFSEKESEVHKVIAQNHQFIGVNNAICAVKSIKDNQGKLGVFWHTQGSGKSFSMVFFSQKIHRTIPGNWTFLVLTDRNDLDNQIYKTFTGCGAVAEAKGTSKNEGRRKGVQAGDGEHLKQLLTEDHRYVFTLIQKFHTERLARYPKLSDRSDIIVIADEAHRSQYDVFARNLRDALPNAAFIGFTGTPLMAGEEMTREVFGDYVSVYNFRQAVEDGATVRLFYENRIPELQLSNEDFTDELSAIVENAELDEDQETAVEREFARQYHLITREERLDTIAKDVVDHYLGLGLRGKAYYVAIDKVTAVRMYNKVQAFWKKRLAEYKSRLSALTEGEILKAEQLQELIFFMEETDMAVVVSGGAYENESFEKKGVDIRPHRKRMMDEDLDTHFKNADHPLRIVFVCAMWLTGFDVPSCSVIYLDKPMRNHSLMQAIARANRVHGDKENGLIVDYVGVFRKLQEALAVYGSISGGGVAAGDSPVETKQVQIDEFKEALSGLKKFCLDHDVHVDKLRQGTRFEQLNRANDAVNKLISPVEVRKAFMSRTSTLNRVYRAIGSDSRIEDCVDDVNFLTTIAEFIQGKLDPVSIDHIFDQVDALLDRSISSKGYVIRESRNDAVVEEKGRFHHANWIDLSDVDFSALADLFKKQKNQRSIAVAMASLLEKKVAQMVNLNPTRIELQERLKNLIDDYNAGTHNATEFFEQLAAFSKTFTEEERRTVSEGLTEEELTVFDLLTKPAPDLTEKERRTVKLLAKQLLEKLKAEKLVIDWRKFSRLRAGVKAAISDTLEDLPETYTDDLYEAKCAVIYNHIFESYYGEGKSRYVGMVGTI
jgi:type I restriction enzyme R subunit